MVVTENTAINIIPAGIYALYLIISSIYILVLAVQFSIIIIFICIIKLTSAIMDYLGSDCVNQLVLENIADDIPKPPPKTRFQWPPEHHSIFMGIVTNLGGIYSN